MPLQRPIPKCGLKISIYCTKAKLLRFSFAGIQWIPNWIITYSPLKTSQDNLNNRPADPLKYLGARARKRNLQNTIVDLTGYTAKRRDNQQAGKRDAIGKRKHQSSSSSISYYLVLHLVVDFLASHWTPAWKPRDSELLHWGSGRSNGFLGISVPLQSPCPSIPPTKK